MEGALTRLPLEALRAELNAIFCHAPNPVLVLDRGFDILSVNEAVLRATQTRREALVGRNVFEAFPENPAEPKPEGKRQFRESVEQVLRTKRPHRMAMTRFDLRGADGAYQPRYWALFNYPILGADGEVLCIVHQAEEVSELVALREREAGHRANLSPLEQAESLVSASEERLRKALSIETVGVLFFNLDGRMVDANETFQRMCGYTVEELRRTVHWKQLTPEEYLPATLKAAGDLASVGRTAPYEKAFIRKDGTRFHGLFAPTVLFGSGTQAECVEFIIDITESKRNQEALREADRRKDEFLAVLAHELRNPLAPIGNALRLLELDPDPQSQVQLRAMMARQLRHLVRLIDDLLDVSRITRGKIELQREFISLAEAAQQAVDASRPLLESRRLELEMNLASEPLWVDADATRLAQVVSNLLHNAAKYTSAGGRIRVEVRREDGAALLSVADSGRGIAPEMLGKVFDLFTQAEGGAPPSEGGLGIGLSIVKGLAELHGGSVRAESPGLGQGSTFTLRLPLARRPAAAIQAQAAGPTALGARKVLVVDDNVDAANSLALLLKSAGSDTRVAYDGEAAIAAALEYRPDAILLDLGLPKKNGYEVCRTLRGAPGGEAPVIVALSGWGQDQDRRKSESAGFDAHLVKPAAFEDVARAIEGTRPSAPASPALSRY